MFLQSKTVNLYSHEQVPVTDPHNLRLEGLFVRDPDYHYLYMYIYSWLAEQSTSDDSFPPWADEVVSTLLCL